MTASSKLGISLDGPPICPNMTDSAFRKRILELRDEAVEITLRRRMELMRWNPATEARVIEWFGSANIDTRRRLTSGLDALARVMASLGPGNFVRIGSDADRATGCLPNMKHLDAEVAHVCRPDTATHTIAINLPFCSLPERSAGNLSSQQLTIVHECAHSADTFDAGDHPAAYGRSACAQFAKRYPGMAIRNADNIAWFILAR
ncbi:M35 family metallo-endopeptidase [Burkholderia pyrrocinia]|uniref:M35 family metallo-endopeptidase n=1 Tax=Burkholderia pyrrocinia TaxID=60550 RepID=UPI001FB48222|nr:M35 family metallo-endopeptidase [Burkholderia pyrrocinia]UOB57477.1 M35 family metallo-endopeptidase [Burkholderia pyrrocinia]